MKTWFPKLVLYGANFLLGLIRPLLFRLRRAHWQRTNQGRPDDVYLVTYPKSGTTWLQNILYQITSEGSMDIHHISKVVPPLETRYVLPGHSADNLPSPRLFKTHFAYDRIPRGKKARYIYADRNGLDVAVSYFHHYQAQKRYKGDLNRFFQLFIKGDVAYGSWFQHVREWRENKNGLNVLYVSYEDLLADLEGNIYKIAEFCNFPIDGSKMPRILEQCSFAFMKANEEKFDLSLEGAATTPYIDPKEIGHGASAMSQEQRVMFKDEMENHQLQPDQVLSKQGSAAC